VRAIVFNGTVGWLHPAPGSRGVVIAGAHGFEDLCSRRFLTLMARGMAQAGLPVLQFDYPGCGDAPGDHTEPDLVASWTSSITSAIEQLKATTGVTDVLLVGFRLGALLVPAAIASRQDVAGLALLAPPSSGKAFVREMTGLSRMIDATLPPYPDAGLQAFDGIEAAGFRMSSQTIADLRMLDWRERVAVDHDIDLLLMPVQASAADVALAEQVEKNGGRVTTQIFADFSRLMSSPTANDIPKSVLEAAVGWAADRAGSTVAVFRNPVQLPATLEGDGYRELPMVLESAPEICGVLCMPRSGKAAGEVVLILNAGAIPHVGWARGAVDMARTLAGRGIASMRIDLPGLGQSGTPQDKRLFLYDERGRDDVMRVIDWLQRYGFERVCAVGLCAGAYQAFHAARYDDRIAHLAMVNPLCFAWNGSYALDMGLSKIRDNARASAKPDEGDKEPDAVTPRATGSFKSSLSKLGRSLLRRSVELSKSASSQVWRRRGLGGQPVERWMGNLTARGTRVLVVSSEDDLSIEEIARHFGPDGQRLRSMEGVTLERLPAADHTLTPLRARQQLTDYIARLLGQP
jgi:pimeloyl-ACP methyl ester carboxylesterase